MQNYEIANRAYFAPDDFPINNIGENIYLCPLPHMACLSVIGEKSEDFLQGQLSCDVKSISVGCFAKGALCSLQGRIKALMDVVFCHDFQLILAKDLVPIVKNDLKTAAMLSRVKLHVSENYEIFGLVGNQKNDLLPKSLQIPSKQKILITEQVCHYQLADDLSMVILHKDLCESLKELFVKKHRLLGSLFWHYHYLKNGYFTIYPSTSDKILPHKVSLHKTDYLNFKKGCYKGQEIIARMHYRAKEKFELKYFTLPSETKPGLLDKLYDPVTKSAIGEIIDFCPIGNNQYFIAASIQIEFDKIPSLSL